MEAPNFVHVLRGKTIAFYNIIKAEISKVLNFYGQTNNIERKNFVGYMSRMGIEPTSTVCRTGALPLSYRPALDELSLNEGLKLQHESQSAGKSN